MSEGVGADAATTAQFADFVGVDYFEREAEFFEHLAAPFVAKRRWAKDNDGPRPVAQ